MICQHCNRKGLRSFVAPCNVGWCKGAGRTCAACFVGKHRKCKDEMLAGMSEPVGEARYLKYKG